MIAVWVMLGVVAGWGAHHLVARMRRRRDSRTVSELHAHAEHASMLARVQGIFADRDRPLDDQISGAFAALRQAAAIDRAVAVCRFVVVGDGVPRLELDRARSEVDTGADLTATARALVHGTDERAVVPLVAEGEFVGVFAVGGREGIMHSHALEAACSAIAAELGRAVARAERATVRWSPDLLAEAADER